MKEKPTLNVVLLVAISILIFSNVSLYMANSSYQNENRQLILQNDSILSVNIHLKDSLNKIAGISTINEIKLNAIGKK